MPIHRVRASPHAPVHMGPAARVETQGRLGRPYGPSLLGASGASGVSRAFGRRIGGLLSGSSGRWHQRRDGHLLPCHRAPRHGDQPHRQDEQPRPQSVLARPAWCPPWGQPACLGCVVRGGGLPPQRPRRHAWPRPLLWLPGTRGMRLSPLVPERREAEWLGQQHLTELPAVHRDRGPRVERPTQPLLRHLAPGGANTACHLADRPTLRQADL